MVPKRELLRDTRVVVDPGLDLAGAGERAVGGELEHGDVPVVLAVRAGRHPSHEVRLVLRREREDLHELLGLGVGELHDDVVRVYDSRRPLADGLFAQLPLVLLQEELLRVCHVVLQERIRLRLEELLRVANVLAKARRHLLDRREQTREDVAVDLEDRVGLADLDRVEDHRAVVGVDDHLDAVAYVVHGPREEVVRERGRADPFRVREAVRLGIGVLNPLQPAVRDDEVGVVVEFEEGGHPADAVGDAAPIEHTAIRGELTADEDVYVAELPGVGETSEEAVERDAPCAVVAVDEKRGGVGGVSGAVELGLVRVDDNDVVGDGAAAFRVGLDEVGVESVALAVVDPRLLEGQHAGGGHVLEQQVGLPARREVGGRRHDRAVAVRIDQLAVHPVLRAFVEAVLEHLARADEHLAVPPVHGVTVDVNVEEVVVEPEVLNLVEGRSPTDAGPRGGCC